MMTEKVPDECAPPAVVRSPKPEGFFATDEEIEAYKKEMETMTSGKAPAAISKLKEFISKQSPCHEQMPLSFMPTSMTRTSPFFPMSRQDMANRPFEQLKWETSWGQMSITGQRLSVYDETVLLALLILSKRQKSATVETTPHEISKIMNVAISTNTYKAIWNSIDYLIGTKIRLDAFQGKGQKRSLKPLMINTILTGATTANLESKKIIVTLNPYFIQMYTESFITNIDFELRRKLKGDISKALYRFYEGQRGEAYSCHILTIANAINVSTKLPMFKIRDRFRKAHAELKRIGYLSHAIIKKTDVVHIWKTRSGLKK